MDPPTGEKPKGKPGAAFERLAAAVQAKLAPGADVRWDEKINDCQIDASVRGTLGTVRLLVIIECKDLDGEKVGKPVVDKLHSVRQQTGANKAIIVTRCGYTEPALKFANKVGIDTCVLGPSRSDDVPGEGELNERVTFRFDSVSRVFEDIEGELEGGEKVPLCEVDRVQGDDGNTAFLDDLLNSWLDSEEGEAYQEGELKKLSIAPPAPLLRDEAPARLKFISFRARWSRLENFVSRIWEAPEQWVFVQHRPDGVVEEARFFEFKDLERLAACFERSR